MYQTGPKYPFERVEKHLRLCFTFSFFFFFFTRFSVLGTRCTVHVLLSTIHAMLSIVYALFAGPTTILFRKKILKIGLTVLFTHLKIILQQCFQFLLK